MRGSTRRDQLIKNMTLLCTFWHKRETVDGKNGMEGTKIRKKKILKERT